jgi:uncharacterized protein YndB with AHSA1/START domain
VTTSKSSTALATETFTLEIRRTIRASAERLFAAWTQPEGLLRWWGPRDVTCIGAEIDLRVGGSYRIANRFPDGRILWIAGTFELILPPHRLTYTWGLEPEAGVPPPVLLPTGPERVTVYFEPAGDATEVIVRHERIASDALREQHGRGWEGCLDGLAEYAEAS